MTKTCSHCARGEIYDTPADWAITGYDYDNNRPVRANVCNNHLEVVQSLGVSIRTIKPLSQKAWLVEHDRRLAIFKKAKAELIATRKHAVAHNIDPMKSSELQRAAEAYDRTHKSMCRAQDLAGLNN